MTTLMTTTRTALGGALALALLPMFWPSDAAAHSCDEPFSTDLIAGRTIDAGDVEVCNDDATLTVTYEATFPWCLLGDPPARRDHPRPARRPGCQHPRTGPATRSRARRLRRRVRWLPGWPGHLRNPPGRHRRRGQPRRHRGHRRPCRGRGWRARGGRLGEGTRFVARGNWAMYFTYAVQEGVCGGAKSCAVFVTSTTHTGNLGGLDGADAICQARAKSGPAAPGTYKAWLSTACQSRRRLRLTHATVPYRLVEGTQVAGDWDDLTDGTLDAPINRDQGGLLLPISQVWTGTAADGSFAGSDCVAWTDKSPASPPPDPPA